MAPPDLAAARLSWHQAHSGESCFSPFPDSLSCNRTHALCWAPDVTGELVTVGARAGGCAVVGRATSRAAPPSRAPAGKDRRDDSRASNSGGSHVAPHAVATALQRSKSDCKRPQPPSPVCACAGRGACGDVWSEKRRGGSKAPTLPRVLLARSGRGAGPPGGAWSGRGMGVACARWGCGGAAGRVR
ncbi:hypothetical protein P7K49_006025 [Saguinus oedipus]|uniref:Uncharacterized protein n=1 Tax=Saguinus oedipus TaxID=9490 RepID=A0ABQ9W189_SAGOE|nr:hypothetical protein P7K49_006025 [Saguinus oedipus]